MKIAKGVSRGSVLGMAATVGCIVPLAASHAFVDLAEVVERDEELWERLSEPHHEVTLGIGYVSEDSFMFGRFNGLEEQGLFLDLGLDLHSRSSYDADEMYFWRLRGRNLGLESRSARFEAGRQGHFSGFLDFRQMPHNQWEDVQIVHRGARTPDLEVDTDNPREFDIKQRRKRGAVGGTYLHEGRWRLSTDFNRETREGTRLRGLTAGGSPAVGNIASSIGPELVDYYTDQYNLRLDYMGDRFQGGAAYHYSAFSQDQGSVMTVDGDTFALEPENTFHRLSFTGGYTVAAGTRVSGDLHLGRMLQDDRFAETATDVTRTGRPRSDIDGEIATTAFNLRGSHRLTDRARLRAAFRYDDRNNRTDTFQVGPRETKPLSYRRINYSLDGDYRLTRRARVSAGVERDERDRDFGDRRETVENTFHTQFRTTFTPALSGGLRAAFSRQNGTTYDLERSRRQTEPEGLRNYDHADRDRFEVGVFATYTPLAMPTISFSGRVNYMEDDYDRSDLGRTDAERFTASGEVSWLPTERLSLYAFLGWDVNEIDLAGGNGEPWTAEQRIEVLTTGIGGEWAVRPDQLDLGFEVVRVESRSRMEFFDAANHPTLESDYFELSLYGEYHMMDQDLTLRAGYMFQHFSEDDWSLGESVVIANPDERDYNVHLFVVSGVYRF